MISVNSVANKFSESILKAIDIAHNIQRSIYILEMSAGRLILAAYRRYAAVDKIVGIRFI